LARALPLPIHLDLRHRGGRAGAGPPLTGIIDTVLPKIRRGGGARRWLGWLARGTTGTRAAFQAIFAVMEGLAECRRPRQC
jgi:hypothetical protein